MSSYSFTRVPVTFLASKTLTTDIYNTELTELIHIITVTDIYSSFANRDMIFIVGESHLFGNGDLIEITEYQI